MVFTCFVCACLWCFVMPSTWMLTTICCICTDTTCLICLLPCSPNEEWPGAFVWLVSIWLHPTPGGECLNNYHFQHLFIYITSFLNYTVYYTILYWTVDTLIGCYYYVVVFCLCYRILFRRILEEVGNLRNMSRTG